MFLGFLKCQYGLFQNSFCSNIYQPDNVQKVNTAVTMNIKDIRETNHYIVFRIGADTDIKNGRVKMVEKALKALEAKEDYVACQPLLVALQYQMHDTEVM